MVSAWRTEGAGGAREVTLADVERAAVRMLEGVPEGDSLDAKTATLIALAVHAAPTALDAEGIRTYAELALDAGATPEQVHETLLVVAGLGFHTLAEGSRHVAEILLKRGHGLPSLDERRVRLWEDRVGGRAYWNRLEAETPGFLDALLRLSPEGFEAFLAFVGVPWRNGALRPDVKELMCMAADATPTHRYLPGLRLHLANAVDLGVGRAAVLQALAIAAAAPGHQGVASTQRLTTPRRSVNVPVDAVPAATEPRLRRRRA